MKSMNVLSNYLIPIFLTISLILYYYLIPFTTADVGNYYIPWYNYIIEHGSARLIVDQFANYTPPYLYLLIFGSLFRDVVDPLTIVKIISIAGTFFLASSIYFLLTALTDRSRATIGGLLALFLPTVVLNGPASAQSDAIYTGFCLFGIFSVIRGRPAWAMACFGFAISFKLQAALLAPFVLYLLVTRRVTVTDCLIGLAAAIGIMVPAWIAGSSPVASYMIYFGQSQFFHKLSMNAPNMWYILQSKFNFPFRKGVYLGLAAGISATVLIPLLALRNRKPTDLDLLLVAFTSVLCLPYVLPKMHDRYFFMADILSLALAIAAPSWRTIACAVLIQYASFIACCQFVFKIYDAAKMGVLPMSIASLITLYMFLSRMVFTAPVFTKAGTARGV